MTRCRRPGTEKASSSSSAERSSSPSRRAGTTKRTEDKAGVLADFGLSEEQGNEIIMAARAHWFEDEDKDDGKQEDAVAESGE